MNSIAASIALAGAILVAGPTAAGQPTAAELAAQPAAAPRLQRPHGPDDATFGAKLVDIYTSYGRVSVDPKLQGPYRETVLTALMCAKGVASNLTAYEAAETLKTMPRESRARVKARDAAVLTDLSIDIIAKADGASPDAIRADETLGPGVYHDAIEGLRVALAQCQLYGVRP